MRARRLSARWVLPIEGPALEHGALLIGADGRIAAVGPEAAVPRPADAAAEDFGDALLLPGLINTHTHLELTGLDGGTPEPEFGAWIRRVRELKAARAPEAFLAAARRGLADCWAAGVTTIADTGDSGAVIEALAEAGGSGIAYQEVFGPHPDQRDASLRGLQEAVARLGRFAGGRVRIGVSPHAPYTVSGPLYAATAAWAREAGLPIAVHLAESPAESALLAGGTGAFADAWRGRGIPMPAPLGPLARGAGSKSTACCRTGRSASTWCRPVRGGRPAARPRECGGGALPAVQPRARPRRRAARGAAGRRTPGGARDRLHHERGDPRSAGGGPRGSRARGARRRAGPRPLHPGRRARPRPRARGRSPGAGPVGRLCRDPASPARPAPQGRTFGRDRVLASGPRDVLATFVGGRDVYRTSPPL